MSGVQISPPRPKNANKTGADVTALVLLAFFMETTGYCPPAVMVESIRHTEAFTRLTRCPSLGYTICMGASELLDKCVGFDWDDGNLLKNWEKHRVSPQECEQLFFNRPLIAGQDKAHSDGENRYYVLGHTDSGRPLFMVFTVRKSRIRVISARDMSRKERKVFYAQEKRDPEI